MQGDNGLDPALSASCGGNPLPVLALFPALTVTRSSWCWIDRSETAAVLSAQLIWRVTFSIQ
jgi:hypothetical protein